MSQRLIDPALQDMLSAAGRDQMAVHDALEGVPRHTTTSSSATSSKHQWADDGAAAGTCQRHRRSADRPDRAHADRSATRIGETMHAVDAVCRHRRQRRCSCSTSQAPDGQSVGQVNPELTRHSRRPTSRTSTTCSAIRSMTSQGIRTAGHPEEPGDAGHAGSVRGDRHRSAGAAGILNEQAYVNGLQYQANFEQSDHQRRNPPTPAICTRRAPCAG